MDQDVYGHRLVHEHVEIGGVEQPQAPDIEGRGDDGLGEHPHRRGPEHAGNASCVPRRKSPKAESDRSGEHQEQRSEHAEEQMDAHVGREARAGRRGEWPDPHHTQTGKARDPQRDANPGPQSAVAVSEGPRQTGGQRQQQKHPAD